MKQIILCADDYGQNPAISQAIIELIKKKRLSATSCMTNSETWPESAAWLIPFKDQVDIGVHLNFTEGKPLSKEFRQRYGEQFFPLSRLLLRTQLRWVDKQVFIAEIQAQLDRFIECIGKLPDFIDGHQHVHQFPVMREALLEVYEQRLRGTGCYIRSVYVDNVWQRFHETGSLKQFIIQWSGARALKQALIKQNIPHNLSFAGIYDFAAEGSFAAKFEYFLKETNDGGLIMCHPGFVETGTTDPIYQTRPSEYHYFASQLFADLCDSHCTLKRFSDIDAVKRGDRI